MLPYSTRRCWWQEAVLLAILLLAFSLRFYGLDAQSFWNDEGTSVSLAQRDLGTITRNAAHDIHPPLYYYLLRGWMLLFGRNVPVGAEFVARSFSALQGLVLVAATYALASRLWGRGAALLVALFSSLSPFQVYYCQEARMYISVTLFGLLSMLALDRLLRQWQEQTETMPASWAVLYIVSITAALYTQYYALSLLLAQNLIFLVWLARPQRHPLTNHWLLLLRWVAMQLVIVLAFAPWLWFARSSLRSWPAISTSLSWRALLADVARVFALGTTTPEDARHRWYGLALALLLAPALVVDLRVWRRQPAHAGDTPSISACSWSNHAAVLPWLYLLIPLVVMYLLSLQRPMYKPKFLLLATPPFYMLQGHGLMVLAGWIKRAFRSRVLVVGVLTLMVSLVCGADVVSLERLYLDPAYARDDYRGIVAYIEDTAGLDDAILINAPTQIETVGYYYRGPLALYPLPLQRPIDTQHTRAALEDITGKHKKIYGIFWATDESDPERFIETWLDAHCFKALDNWYGNVRLVVYAVPLASAVTIEQPMDFALGEFIHLRGYTLLTPESRRGDILQLTLFWEAEQPIPGRYKVFCHLVDASGNIISQRDSEPGGGLKLTSDWPPRQLIVDNYGLPIPPDAMPGRYLLRVGMYSLDDGRRLPVSVNGRSTGDSIDLHGITISP